MMNGRINSIIKKGNVIGKNISLNMGIVKKKRFINLS